VSGNASLDCIWASYRLVVAGTVVPLSCMFSLTIASRHVRESALYTGKCASSLSSSSLVQCGISDLSDSNEGRGSMEGFKTSGADQFCPRFRPRSRRGGPFLLAT
jgi:hypothetical protein